VTAAEAPQAGIDRKDSQEGPGEVRESNRARDRGEAVFAHPDMVRVVGVDQRIEKPGVEEDQSRGSP